MGATSSGLFKPVQSTPSISFPCARSVILGARQNLSGPASIYASPKGSRCDAHHLPVRCLFWRPVKLWATRGDIQALTRRRLERVKRDDLSARRSSVSASPMCFPSIQERDRASQLCGLRFGQGQGLTCADMGALGRVTLTDDETFHSATVPELTSPETPRFVKIL